MSGYPYSGTVPTRPSYPSYGGSDIHAPSYSTRMGNGARDEREPAVALSGGRHPNVNNPNFACTNVNANSLHETTTPTTNKSNNLSSNTESTAPASTAIMFSGCSHNTIEGGEFKNIGGNMTTGNVGSIPSGTESKKSNSNKKGEPPIQPTRTTSSKMFDNSPNNNIKGGKFVNIGGDFVDTESHGNGGNGSAK